MNARLAISALSLLLAAQAASAQSGNAVVVVPVPLTGATVQPAACPLPAARPRAADNVKGESAVARDKPIGKTLSAQVLRDPGQLELQAGHWQ